MKSTNGYLYVALLVLICGFALIAAKTANAQTESKGFRHFTPQDGFPSYVFRLAQDPMGQIWITSPSGLSKFDGYTIHNFIHNPSDEFSVPEGIITEILTDNEGRIWLSSNTGIAYVDPQTERFRQVSIPDSIPPLNNFRALFQTSDQFIWTIGGSGLYRFSQPTQSQPNPDVRFYPSDIFLEEQFYSFSLAEFSSDHIWLTSSLGLIEFDRKNETYSIIDPFSGLDIDLEILDSSEILRDAKGNIWLGLEGGLVVFREGTKNPEVVTSLGEENFDLSNTSVSTLDPAADGSLFVGIRDQGVLHFKESTNELVQYSRQQNSQGGISENTVFDIMEDMDGNIWVGHSNSGMSMIYDKNWTYSYHQITGIEGATNRSNIVNDIAEDQESNLWLSTYNGLAFVPADGNPTRLYLLDPEVPSTNFNQNNFIYVHLDGDTIFAAEYNGYGVNSFHTFNIQQEEFRQINIPDSLRTYFENVVATETSLYWTVRGSSKLVELNKEDLSIKTYGLPLDYPLDTDSAGRNVLVQPFMTHSGDLYIQYKYAPENLFITTNWNYFKFDKSQETFTSIPMSTPRDLRKYIFPETTFPSALEDHVIWSIAENGLLKEDLSDGTYIYYPLSISSNELSFSSGFQLQDGTIWFSGFSGTLRSFDPNDEKVHSYRLEFSRKPSFFNVGLELSNGSIFLGGSGGYIKFDPDQIRNVEDLEHLHITEFQAGTESIPTVGSDQIYEIDYENNNISFTYRAVNYRSPDSQYRYRLLGYNDDWVNMGTQRSIFFANLPFGDYTFEVQGAIPGSLFSDDNIRSQVSFSILPPWWRTIPAYLAYFFLFGGFVFTVDRVQRRRLLQKERERARDKELEQAKKIEEAYENLKAAKEQLVQQEKLASLGQLTAGIAHEIKNPLNFVNNFSDVSLEMVRELIDEMKKGNLKEAEELANDISQNLKKIHDHGFRADSIVKSMLQHSRGGNGKPEPTNLNALVKEYVNLAYHGMRAGDDPVNVDINLDLDKSIGEVNLVAEDFSRVILNLCNNAFDAMREKEKRSAVSGQPSVKYSPKLTIRTQKSGNTISIEIEDNGPGIPDEIKDKILQPFFTTKKGTQGTGLGLSITHDIVKAHGGSLKINSKPNKGSTFIISLNQEV